MPFHSTKFHKIKTPINMCYKRICTAAHTITLTHAPTKTPTDASLRCITLARDLDHCLDSLKHCTDTRSRLAQAANSPLQPC